MASCRSVSLCPWSLKFEHLAWLPPSIISACRILLRALPYPVMFLDVSGRAPPTFFLAIEAYSIRLLRIDPACNLFLPECPSHPACPHAPLQVLLRISIAWTSFLRASFAVPHPYVVGMLNGTCRSRCLNAQFQTSPQLLILEFARAYPNKQWRPL